MEDTLQSGIDHRVRRVDHSVNVFERFMDQKMHDLKVSIERFAYAFERFRLALVQTRQHIERNQRAIYQRYDHVLEQAQSATKALVRLFTSFDVKKVLDRGFSIVRSESNIVKDAAQLAGGAKINVQLANGNVDAEVCQRKM
jgi:exodeoxyribonuclease VII large subunit